MPAGHKSRYDAVEASKEEQVRGTGIRAEGEHLESVNPSPRSSSDTRVDHEKEQERMDRIPSTNRGKFNV